MPGSKLFKKMLSSKLFPKLLLVLVIWFILPALCPHVKRACFEWLAQNALRVDGEDDGTSSWIWLFLFQERHKRSWSFSVLNTGAIKTAQILDSLARTALPVDARKVYPQEKWLILGRVLGRWSMKTAKRATNLSSAWQRTWTLCAAWGPLAFLSFCHCRPFCVENTTKRLKTASLLFPMFRKRSEKLEASQTTVPRPKPPVLFPCVIDQCWPVAKWSHCSFKLALFLKTRHDARESTF